MTVRCLDAVTLRFQGNSSSANSSWLARWKYGALSICSWWRDVSGAKIGSPVPAWLWPHWLLMKASSGSWLQEITADETVLNFTLGRDANTFSVFFLVAGFAFSPNEFLITCSVLKAWDACFLFLVGRFSLFTSVVVILCTLSPSWSSQWLSTLSLKVKWKSARKLILHAGHDKSTLRAMARLCWVFDFESKTLQLTASSCQLHLPPADVLVQCHMFGECVCSWWQPSPSLTSVFQNPIFFFFFAGPPSVLRFYTESAGSPSEQSVITSTQKPQPDHQSAATAAAAAMVRHEISFEGMIFTWYDGADTRCSSDDKKKKKYPTSWWNLNYLELSRWSLISGIYVLGKCWHGGWCSVLGKSQLFTRLMSRWKLIQGCMHDLVI